MNSLLRAICLVSVPALVALAGCTAKPAANPAEVARYRAKLTLAEEPDGAQTVLDIRSVLLGEEPPDVKALLAHNHEDEEHAHEGEAHEGEAHEGEAHEGESAEQHSADDEHAGHDHADHDHADHDHADHEHADHEHADHEHEPALTVESKSMDVSLVGLVGGVPNPFLQSSPEFPFTKNQALFFLADPEAIAELEEHGHQHAPGEECAFCLANAADGKLLVAAVQFVDEHGKVLPIDARDLFDLKAKETVVVQGSAKVVPGGILTVNATGLYVRR